MGVTKTKITAYLEEHLQLGHRLSLLLSNPLANLLGR